ncbi:GMC family oxidoreductase N-terminal domain-containing protein [Luteimonas sp. TWI1416]|uniref:GMC family oxidoreductase n=1 Tax=unclassified Luteimonas TaxID=2629088 RepID=UPI0032099A3A
MPPTPPPVYDYIIVGAGAAGCVLAHRLSADPQLQVLLLEAGPNDTHPFLHMPAAAGKLRGRGVTWDDTTAPQPQLAGRTLRWPHGRVLGGSSAIDAMCYTRGAPADYDDWAAHGAEGWAWRDVLPWFRRAEGNIRGGDMLHGGDGPLTVSDLRHVDPRTRMFIEAARQAGLPATTDFNGPDPHGVGLYQVTQREGARCSAATAYLDRATRARPNLTIVTGARVNRVTFEHGRASGVVYATARGAFHQPATREVLLCGGAINSPQLLMLSGIGPAMALRRHGLPVVHDAPDVGRHLRDALGIRIALRSDSAARHRRLREVAMAWDYFVRGRRGAGTSNGFEAGGFFRSSLASDDRADIQLHFAPAQLEAHDATLGAGCSLRACVLRPRSRGHVQLTGNRIADRPRIDPGYLTDPAGFDLRMLVECARIARTILAQPAFDGIRSAPLPPGDGTSEAALATFVRDQAESVHRAVGTCRMGDDAQAVVDPQLRVRGVAALRVVDTSVMPTLPGGDLNAPVVMLAERAAALILKA